MRFFIDVMGLTESGRRGESVYLRGWDDYERHTLKLTAAKVAGMGHFAYRATSPEALQRRAAAIEKSGRGKGWTDGDLGHGPAYAFTTPDGHNMEIYYETEWYKPPPELAPALKNQAQRFPARGINARRLDHMNLLTSDVAELRHFLEDVLGLAPPSRSCSTAARRSAAGSPATTRPTTLPSPSTTTAPRAASTTSPTRSNSREEILRAADIFLEAGVPIETGPHKHAIQQTFFLYVYEPGGNRVEVANAGARLMLAPDWQPIVWTEAERKKGQAWGLKTVETFHTHGTPPIDQYTGPRHK